MSVSVCLFGMRWLRLVGSLKTQVSFAKEPYKRDYILQMRPIFLKSPLIIATPYVCTACMRVCMYMCMYVYISVNVAVCTSAVFMRCVGLDLCMYVSNVCMYVCVYPCAYVCV